MRNDLVRRGLVASLLVAAVGLGPTACTTNLATGDKIFAMVSPEQEAQIGAQAAPELAQEFGGPVQNAQLQQYVTNIGKKLAAETEGTFPSLPWEFTLLDSPVVNAFSLPGGKVFITRGLAEKMTNEAQMAGVLGHEIGHVTAQHVVRRMSQQQLLAGGLAVTGIAVGATSNSDSGLVKYGIPALSAGGSLLLLKFGRDEESQADSLGLRYMSKAGYNPKAQLEVMQILANESQGESLEMLQTHPLPQTRIQRLQSELDKDYANVVNNPNYQFFPERFQQQFLAIAKTLPPPKQQPQQQGQGQAPAKGGQASGLRSSPPANQQRISRPAR